MSATAYETASQTNEVASVSPRVQNTTTVTADAQESRAIDYIPIPILLLRACVINILCALRLCICILVLFGIPVYYSSGASLLLQCTTGSSLEQDIPSAAHSLSDNSTVPSGLVYPPDLTPGECLGSPLKVREAWSAFLDDRTMEWKVLFTLACVLATFSLTVFQIPQATDDPLTRMFASLAVYRAFSSMVYGSMFLLYFRRSSTQTASFVTLWLKDSVDTRKRLWNPWTMLSLPAVSTLWALLFDLFTILSFTLRGSDLNPEEHHMHTLLQVVVVIRVMIVFSILVDVLCIVGTLVTLVRYRTKD